MEVPVSPYDSLIVDTNTVVRMDITRVFVDNGFLAVEQHFVCGDIDFSGGIPDISDILYMVEYMFQGGPPPPIMESSDVNNSGGVPNITDLIRMVDYMFQGGAILNCGN
jgi:hypothetical protein